MGPVAFPRPEPVPRRRPALARAALAGFAVVSLAACRGGEARTASRPTDSASAARPADSAPVPASSPSAPAIDARVTRADRARIMGDSSAKVWVVIVSDFQCPFCKVWHDSTAPVLKKEFVDQGIARFAYVHFPLGQHQGAMPAAEASMCAGAQGKFWEFHDKLFATQQEWETNPAPAPVFSGYAKALGLDEAEYKQCVDGHVMAPMIEADVEKSKRAGTRSTPTFIIGDFTFSGAQPIDTFRTAITKTLQSQAK